MGFRRLFIIRKDLHLSAGKLAAQVAHCAEAYWTKDIVYFSKSEKTEEIGDLLQIPILVEKDVFENYINASFTKTICEARNKEHLLKARDQALLLGLHEGNQFGLIYDKCLTELEPEEEDGTTLTGIWFCPLPDEVAHKISKKYQLYKS